MPHYIWKNKHWTTFSWDEKKLLPLVANARLKQGKLLSKIAQLDEGDASQAQAQILLAETTKTALIEGEKYDQDLVRSSIHRRLGLSYAGLPTPQRHIEGLVDMVFDATTSIEQDLTLERLKAWQAALFPSGYSNLQKIVVGELRDDALGPMQVVSGSVNKERVHYEAPPAELLPELMDGFLKWFNNSREDMEGLLRAGVAHFYFITIHPFSDGNGRIARALTDRAIAQDDLLQKRYYSLSDQIVKQRDQYYAILESSQKGESDITSWLSWFIQCFDSSLDRSDELLENIFTKVSFWKEHQHLELSQRQRKVITKLLEAQGKGFEGGLTTRKYVAMTRVSRATAYREITDLVDKRVLKQNKSGGGRSVSYGLVLNR